MEKKIILFFKASQTAGELVGVIGLSLVVIGMIELSLLSIIGVIELSILYIHFHHFGCLFDVTKNAPSEIASFLQHF